MQHHGAGLRRLLTAKKVSEKDQAALLDALIGDPANAKLLAADRAMLDYAMRLTRRPAAIRESDIAALRAVGFDDRAIHDICTITAYYAFVNRVADGLGVELESP